MANPQRKKVSFNTSHSQPDILTSSSGIYNKLDSNNNYKSNVQSQPLVSSSLEAKGFKTVRDHFVDFMDIPMEPFVSARQATTSTGTRGPKFFDLHLHPELQLRKIVVMDDIPQQMAKVCDGFISKHLLHLPAFSKLPLDIRGPKQRNLIHNESSLAYAYCFCVGSPLSILSSTLVFENNTFASISDYTLSSKEYSSSDKNFAKPDGILCFVNQNDSKEWEKEGSVFSSLSTQHKDDIKLILKHDLHGMALWEFKNLVAGSKEVMDKFVRLEGDFAWSGCLSSATTCQHNKHDNKGQLSITGRRIGFDAKYPRIVLWIVPKGTTSSVGVRSPDSDQPDIEIKMVNHAIGSSSGTAGGNAAIWKGSPLPKALETKKSSAETSRKSRAGKITALENSAKESKHKEFVLQKTTVPEKNVQKPHDMAQQLWAEGVKYNSTFLVLSSGNYEIIGIRHRETQTLYISHVFELTDPIYKKTHIGLHALAYYDALDRACQLEALDDPVNPNPIPPRFHNITCHVEAYPPVYQPAGPPVILNADGEVIYEKLLKELKTMSKFEVTITKTFYNKNSQTTIQDLQRLKPTALSDSLSDWSLTQGPLIAGRVYSVIARNQNQCFSNRLVMKMAGSLPEYNQLEYEYSSHVTISAKGFGVQAFGIFHLPDMQRGLLMEWSGDPCSVRNGAKLVKQLKPKCIEAMNALHSDKVVKFHGYLKPDHLLLTEGGGVSFISFRPKLSKTKLTTIKAAEMEFIDSL